MCPHEPRPLSGVPSIPPIGGPNHSLDFRCGGARRCGGDPAARCCGMDTDDGASASGRRRRSRCSWPRDRGPRNQPAAFRGDGRRPAKQRPGAGPGRNPGPRDPRRRWRRDRRDHPDDRLRPTYSTTGDVAEFDRAAAASHASTRPTLNAFAAISSIQCAHRARSSAGG